MPKEKNTKIESSFECTALDIGTKTAIAQDAVETRKTVDDKIVDPHSYGDLKPTSYTETFTHMIKGNIGCGMLAMGAAYKHGGILMSTVLIIAIGIISTYNQYILICMANKFQRESKQCERLSFASTIQHAFQRGPLIFQKTAKCVRMTVDMFIILTQLGFCCVYIMMVSTSLNQIFHSHGINISVNAFMTISLPIFLLTSLVRELKYIAPISTLANISTMASLGLILYNNVQDLPPLSTRKMIGEWSEISLCFGTVVYSLEGISLVLPLQQNMKNKARFLGPFGVLNVSISIVVLLMINIGFFGYYKHGEHVADTLTLNLDSTNIITQVVIGCMVLGILCSYALQFFIPVLLLLPWIRRHTSSWPLSRYHIYEYILRTALVLLTYIVAKMIPHFELFISLIGAVGSSFLALIYTPLADLAVRKNRGFLGWRIMVALLSLLIGISGFLIGTTMSLKNIAKALQEDAIKSDL